PSSVTPVAGSARHRHLERSHRRPLQTPGRWDQETARRFVGGFAVVSMSSLLIAVGAMLGMPRAAILSLIVAMLIGSGIGMTAYKAAGEPGGRIFAVGRPAAAAAGLPTRVWDVLVMAVLAAAILP